MAAALEGQDQYDPIHADNVFRALNLLATGAGKDYVDWLSADPRELGGWLLARAAEKNK